MGDKDQWINQDIDLLVVNGQDCKNVQNVLSGFLLLVKSVALLLVLEVGDNWGFMMADNFVIDGIDKESFAYKSFERFSQNLSNWIQIKGLINNNLSSDEIAEMELLLKTDVSKLSQREALNMSFKFHYYLDYLYSIHNKEKAILDWCEESIWYIVCDKLKSYGDQYTKWQEKYNAAVKENPLASEINKLRNNVKCRVTLLSGRLENLKKLAEVLHDIGKRFN